MGRFWGAFLGTVGFLAALAAFFWLLCRLKAERCPSCGSKWRTELMGEWGCEEWHCHHCGHWWDHPSPPTPPREGE